MNYWVLLEFQDTLSPASSKYLAHLFGKPNNSRTCMAEYPVEFAAFSKADLNRGLTVACELGHLDLELANLMISKGANDWNGGLEGACLGGHLELAHLMISKGARYWNGGSERLVKAGTWNLLT